MRIANREEVAVFYFLGVAERIIIGQHESGNWVMVYLRHNGSEQATISQIEGVQSREEILRRTKRMMEDHGACLISNLIQSQEIFLPSQAAMNIG